jgi:8-oxo-dGTP pyrophosphatase MutT (NUDIX family)
VRATDSDPTTPPQVIPRPSGARPGGPAPWGELDPSARVGLSLERVRTALRRAGREGPPPAGGEHADPPWITVLAEEPPGPVLPAAVLVALFEEDGEARVVLTRRASGLRSHQGEVSFPGGRIDTGEDAVRAARREAAEEVGLDPGAVRVLGWLGTVQTFVSGSLITPVVATLEHRPVLEASPDEVERVFDVALAALADPGAFHEERWRVPGRTVLASADGSFPVWFFEAAGEIIWGATARILYELLSMVLGVTPATP